MYRVIQILVAIIFLQLSTEAQCPVILNLRTPIEGESFHSGDTVKLEFAIIESSVDYFNGDVVLSFSSNLGSEWQIQDTIFQDSPFFINPMDTSIVKTYEDLLQFLDSSTFITTSFYFVCPNTISDSCLILLNLTQTGCYGGTTEPFSITNSSSVFLPLQIDKSSIEIFPNPLKFNDILNIKSPIPVLFDEIQVINTKGEIVKNLKQSDNRVELGGIASGTYFVRLFKGNQIVGIKKLQVH